MNGVILFTGDTDSQRAKSPASGNGADAEFGQTSSVLSQVSEISYLCTQIQTSKQIHNALEQLQQGNDSALQVGIIYIF